MTRKADRWRNDLLAQLPPLTLREALTLYIDLMRWLTAHPGVLPGELRTTLHRYLQTTLLQHPLDREHIWQMRAGAVAEGYRRTGSKKLAYQWAVDFLASSPAAAKSPRTMRQDYEAVKRRSCPPHPLRPRSRRRHR